MAFLRWATLASLGIAFCVGCGDSSTTQPWESKAQPPTDKKVSKSDDTKDKVAAQGSSDSENPHQGMDPHAGMGMRADDASETLDNDGTLDVAKAHWTVPKSWIRKAPAMPDINKAEYAIPKAEGDKADGRLTVGTVGSDADSNIGRWKHQFSAKLDKEKQETINAGGVEITLVDLSGTFDDSMGPMSHGVAHPDYRMLGAVFEAPGEIPGKKSLYFVKCSGPEKTIAQQADEIKGFLKSLKVDK